MKFNSYYQNNSSALRDSINWENYSINDRLLYSHRNTLYDLTDFPSSFHYHDYYEIVVFEEGNIRYICETKVYYPKAGDVILIPPGQFHMSAINSESTLYNRHVFYLYPEAFDAYGCSRLNDFLKEKSCRLISYAEPQKSEMIRLLHKIEKALSFGAVAPEYALAISYIFQLFYLFNRKYESNEKTAQSLPKNILDVKKYIDDNCTEIRSVEQVADHFYYSREYTSRLFKKYFDIPISEYILQRKIIEAQKRISGGCSITETAYAVGFGSISAFIKNFKKVMGELPSEYRRNLGL